MNQERYINEKRGVWEELEEILVRIDRGGLRALSPGELRRLGELYRRTASHLAYAKVHFPGSGTVTYLNQLVARAHSRVYLSAPASARDILGFFRNIFPQAFRRASLSIGLAASIFLLGSIAGYVAIALDPNLAEALVPENIRNFTAQAREGEIFPEPLRPLISSLILINNVKVGILAFGLGLTLGLGTAYVLFSNGLLLGALAAHFQAKGLGLPFWSLILPHAVLELIAIFVAGGAGFLLGWALIDPGHYTRRDALVLRGRQAIALILGSLPFFLVAAAIEGFITPLGVSPWAKLAFAAMTGMAALFYLGRGRRVPVSQPSTPLDLEILVDHGRG